MCIVLFSRQKWNIQCDEFLNRKLTQNKFTKEFIHDNKREKTQIYVTVSSTNKYGIFRREFYLIRDKWHCNDMLNLFVCEANIEI